MTLWLLPQTNNLTWLIIKEHLFSYVKDSIKYCGLKERIDKMSTPEGRGAKRWLVWLYLNVMLTLIPLSIGNALLSLTLPLALRL